ncbi:serine acetyltransferase [Superficieibacter electus]|uniref:Serine acetyltransferase n=1 Tax=Superficieibacter electus TaxID=2022662 RepID=A0A2P5GLS1_9ENTR|nr:serine acetyltransferase [Superficieibacter electus]POP42993.1 serine acetyltransferase [Superficieibacter electus]POP46488.1 serine acetyltransferase [Superficieibacter electus]
MIHIIIFLLSKKSADLKSFWREEITTKNKISLFRLYLAHKNRNRHFLLWWRLASQMYLHGNTRQKRVAKKINWSLQSRYASDIALKATIGRNPKFIHLTGVVISGKSIIGDNAVIYQNVTIGLRKDDDPAAATVGNNVNIGAGTCIMGNVSIGHNVNIGAMSLVLSDIPDDATYVCKINPEIILRC